MPSAGGASDGRAGACDRWTAHLARRLLLRPTRVGGRRGPRVARPPQVRSCDGAADQRADSSPRTAAPVRDGPRCEPPPAHVMESAVLVGFLPIFIFNIADGRCPGRDVAV